MMSSDQQWLLIQTGNFDEGQTGRIPGSRLTIRCDAAPGATCHRIRKPVGSLVRPKSEIRALAAAVLAASAVLILFLRLQKQEHLSQLQETERNALRESEETFSSSQRAVNRLSSSSPIRVVESNTLVLPFMRFLRCREIVSWERTSAISCIQTISQKR